MVSQNITHTSIETTNACNLFCRACKTPHGTSFISTDKFIKLAKALEGYITGLALHWRGEPCLHPRLPELAEIAHRLDLNPWVSTNTSVPNLSKPNYVRRLLDNLDWIEFCVDGCDEDTSSKYRHGANWNQIKKNLNTISNIKTPCIKKMRVLMFKYNDGKESIYRDMASKYHMDEIIFARPLIGLEEIISKDDADKWLSSNPKYRRYYQKNGVWRRITGTCNPNPVISVHGTVHPCGLDWALKHSLGNLVTWSQTLKRYKKMSRRLGTQEMCKLCCVPRQQVNFMEKIIKGEGG